MSDQRICVCSHGHGPYPGSSAGATWRVSFGILIPLVLYVLYYRIYVLKELKLLASVKKRDNVKGVYNAAPTVFMLTVTCALSWWLG